MSFYENEMSRWNLRHVRGIAELLEPVVSPSNAKRFSSEKSISGIDQCLHIPGKADSAYSSFSGGSNIPECPIPLGYNEHDSLPLEQLSYMDTGYVRGIFNLSAINPGLPEMYEDKAIGKKNHYKLDNTAHSKSNGSTPTHGMSYQASSPLVEFLSPLPPPPSPSAQVDSYKTNKNVAQTHSGICFEPSMQAEVCIKDTDKDLLFYSPANYHNDYWLSRCEDESLVTEESDIWYPTSQYIPPKINSPISTKTQKILCTQNSVCTYTVPEVMDSKPSPLLHTSHNAVNDTQENKQYFYASSVHKPPFRATDLPSTMAVSSTQEGQFHGVLHPFRVPDLLGLDQDVYESCMSLKYIGSSLPNKAEPGIIKSYESKKCFFSSEEENSRDVWQPLLNQQTRMQKPPSHGLDLAKTPLCEIYETADTISYYTNDAEYSASRPLSGFRKAKKNDMNSSPDLPTNPRQEEMLKPVCFPKQHFSKKAESQSQDDSTSIKINRRTTPLLYYLSGGKNPSFMSHENQTQDEEDFAMRSPRSNFTAATEPIEIPRDTNTYVDNIGSNNEGLIPRSPASSVDEKFKNDYREKLKVAQSKVLRETSFKRKDLQMSLPVRLKQKPSSRPSIQHLRSLSLSSTNEDSKLIPAPKPLESISNEDESMRPQTARIGGRKRATKEQKKISYSEPEKLNQLDDQRDQSALWTKKNARSRSDEINEQDSMIIGRKAQRNQGRALLKAELKQIQHNALLEYMERKIGQRPAAAQSSTQRKPPLLLRTSNAKRFLEDSAANPSTSRKLQSIDGFCQFPVPGKILEPLSFSPALTSTTGAMTDRCSARSPVFDMANSKVQPADNEGSCVSKCASTKSIHHSCSVSSKGRGRSKSTPSPVQVFHSSTACPALSAQDHEYYPTHPNFPSKEELEADPSDKTDALGAATKQSPSTAERRGKSMEETGTSKMIKLSPLSQSMDQLHRLKHWHISSGLETGKNHQAESHPDTLQHCEPASGHLLRQPHAEGVAGVRGLNPTVQELEQPHSTDQLISTFRSLGNPTVSLVPPPSVGKLPSPNVPLESLPSLPAPSPADMDNEVFKDSFASSSETASDLATPCGQSRGTIPDRKTPELALPASALQTSIKGKQIKEKFNTSQRSSECTTDPSHGTKSYLGESTEDATFHTNRILSKDRESLDDPDSITSKKRELISSIQLKLQTLWDERELIQSEAKEHTVRGKQLESLVQELCKPNEYERYIMFIGDLEKVVNLLLCLSSRLARVQNAMGKMDENTDAEEKQSLKERHRLLSRQREDAKDLKENLDRRERVVSGILSKYMTKPQLQDYRHFVQEKTSLLIEQKDLEEQIKFLEEKLERLGKSIPL
ncbi:protein Shroom1 isoform X2 [Rhineura floridana]|uniref:protein Shroom1 isoform X2 n=1 Tax=Rhineura floridana TaxID=261503 RepID=UPI002AC820AC|nr:protein Shroom1 isoform X2 [Rhineura floridana]